ncbi:MAG: PQQ-binding-like beta-propeller repeat protein [Planctomycetota bacterium]
MLSLIAFRCPNLALLALPLLLASGGSTAWGDWPAFRGPTRDGVIAASELPTKWSATENVTWRTELPGQGWSSPIVVEDRIYLTAAVPMEPEAGDNQATAKQGYTLELFILSTETGELISRLELFQQPASAPRIHKKNSHASPTVLHENGRLYVHFGHQGTACLSTTGQIIWRNDSLSYKPVHGNGGSPTIAGDLLIFSRDGGDVAEVTALDKNTGEIVWQTARDVEVRRTFSFCTPYLGEIEGRLQLILPGSNVVQSLNPATGEELWRLRYEGYSVIPRPVYHAGLIFVCTGYDRPKLLAIDPTGVGDVTETHLRWQSDDSIPHTPSLVATNNQILAVSDKGVAICFDATTGEERWKKRVGGNFSASPLLSGSSLYLQSEQGKCTVFELGVEPEKVAVNDIGERTLASFAVVEKDLLIRTDKALYRISNGL